MDPSSNKTCFKCFVPPVAQGLLLVDYLSKRFTYYKSLEWQKLLESKQILLNGKTALTGSTVVAGDEIRYFAELQAEPKVPKKISIIYEDQDLLVVNKPAHLPVHPSGRYLRNTLVHLIRDQKKNNQLFLAHRIDRETSGLCVLTKSTLAKEKMYWVFFEGQVEKSYWALLWGKPPSPSGMVDAPIGAVPKNQTTLSKIRIKQIIGGEDSKRAQTKYRTLQTNWIKAPLWLPPPWPSLDRSRSEIESRQAWPISLVECRPITGRTNQIRVHMAHLGCGLVGDKLYDPSEEVFLEMTSNKPLLEDEIGLPGSRIAAHLKPRLVLDAHALHARSLKFRHPRTGQLLHLEAPTPGTWQGLYRS